jgi:hypothetical protein
VMLTGLPFPGLGDYLSVADQTNVRVVAAPYAYLYSNWFHDSGAPATIEAARSVLWPLVDEAKTHPSLLAYDIYDEPHSDTVPKMGLAVQAMAERDPDHPATPILLLGFGSPYVAQQSNLPINLIDVYPVSGLNPDPCALTMDAFSEPGHTMEVYLQGMLNYFPASGAPLWVIGQVFDEGPAPLFRMSLVEEIRLQHWISIGYGAKGIFWFLWDGGSGDLRHSPAQLAEVKKLGARLGPLKPLLLSLNLAPQQFTAGPSTFVSTLTGGGKTYAVIVNRTCAQGPVSVTRPGQPLGGLRNVETGRITMLGQQTLMLGGDGGIFEVVEAETFPTPTTLPTLTITVHPGGCMPRPEIMVRIESRVGALSTISVTSLRPISQISFGQPINATTSQLHINGYTATFTATRTAGGAWTVPFTVTDACGPWQSFVGAGS